MKHSLFAAALLLSGSILFPSCTRKGSNNMHLTLHESDDRYNIEACYDPARTGKVEALLNEHLKNSGMSFTNAEIDADLIFDDGAKVYMKKHPGLLQIMLNKKENSATAYREMKELGEGLKPVVTP